jgi:hypothetical protein
VKTYLRKMLPRSLRWPAWSLPGREGLLDLDLPPPRTWSLCSGSFIMDRATIGLIMYLAGR